MKIVIIGSGSIGSGIIPMLFQEFPELKSEDIQILSAGPDSEAASQYGINLTHVRLTAANYVQALEPHVHPGVIVLNLSVDVSSMSVLAYCQSKGAHYLDTCIEPWAGGYTNSTGSPIPNATFRHSILTDARIRNDNTTAILACGANPGLVSCFVKQAMMDIVENGEYAIPKAVLLEGLPAVARHLKIHTIQIAERDTQTLGRRLNPGEFANTWSVPGFISEGEQFAELAYGAHEDYKNLKIFSHAPKRPMAILPKKGFQQRVASYTPTAGADWAYLISHHESASIADMLSTDDYRPTVYYAYRPTEAAVRSIENHIVRDWKAPKVETIFAGKSGYDELGVLLMSPFFTYWYGSTLNTAQARALMPYNGPTTLQVTATIAAAVRYIVQNPFKGVIEAEQLPFDKILDQTKKYLGHVAGYEVEWHHGTQLEQFLYK